MKHMHKRINKISVHAKMLRDQEWEGEGWGGVEIGGKGRGEWEEVGGGKEE